MNPASLGEGDVESIADRVVEDLHRPSADGSRPRYPGERALETRRRNLQHGIPVDPEIWKNVQTM
jgi:LDH2 family malate/lactate/ureidoglycolate dehydrogenase